MGPSWRAALVACLVLGLSRIGLLSLGSCVPDSGTTGDGGCDDAGQTVNDQCVTVYTELCKQGARCNTPVPSLTDCVSSDVAEYCCTGSACNAWSCQSPTQVSTCTSEIDSEDCNMYVNNQTPADCAPFTNAM
jgi:hypothetical protein